MSAYKLPLLILGIVLILAAGIWHLGLSERWEKRLPDGWVWEMNTLGTNRYPEENGEYPPDREFPADDDINLTERTIMVTDTSAPAGSVEISDHSFVRDAITSAVIWDYTATAVVDPHDARHTEYPDDYFIFPRNVEKTTYNIRNSSYKGLPVEYVGEEEIEGILTYHFAFHGEMDNTEGYPDQPLEANQKIHCADLYLEYWVEPRTGEVIKFKEGCAGDYVYDTQTGENLIALSRWSAESSPDDIIRRVNTVNAQRRTLLLTTSYIPLLLAAAGVVVLGVGAAGYIRS